MNRLFIITLLISQILLGQEPKKEAKSILLSINHSFQIPGGDMKKRFGTNSDLSVSLIHKGSKNYIINLEIGALFGGNVKENNLFDHIDGNNGVLISATGEIPIIRLFERGAHLDINFGKYFPITTQKYESGIIISIGGGYMYHKILIETITTQLPQLTDDLLKGYDRLCGGFLTKQFIGYYYFSNKNNIRFFLGIEAIQGFTKDLREYNYTAQTYNTNHRIDHLIGLKCGFIIPIKKRETGKYYYY